jgi:hypothetical protein
MSNLTEVGGEKFNLSAMLTICRRAKKEVYSGSDRTLIDVYMRLIKAVMREHPGSGPQRGADSQSQVAGKTLDRV